MKKGTVCRCKRCGGEYLYTGGRKNPLCPNCYQEDRLKRVEMLSRKKSAEQDGAAPERYAKKQGARGRKNGKKGVKRLETVEREKPKLSKKQMEQLMKDPVCRLVHELELVNREREKKGLPPLSYGKYVQEYKR